MSEMQLSKYYHIQVCIEAAIYGKDSRFIIFCSNGIGLIIYFVS
jgi:hypothetical protein